MPDTMMQPETTERPSLKNLAGALCKAQAEMEGAKKDQNNPHFNRKYADLASVWNTIREPLTKNGLSVVQLLRSMQGGVEVETILLHTSGEQISDVFSIPANKSDAQGFGSAATYARRYALMAIVGVAPEEDDGNAAAASHRPGAAGSAGGGSDFRPDGPRKMSPKPANWVDESRADGTLNETRPKGQLAATPAANGKKTAAEKAKEWTDVAIKTIGLSGQTVGTLRKFEDASKDKLEWLEANAPLQHERFYEAFNEAKEAAQAVAA